MKVVHITHFATDGNIVLVNDAPKPEFPPPSKSTELLVKVLACALNPADCRLMDGSVSLVMKPKEFPYVPGLDICGIIEQVSGDSPAFNVGDRIIAALPAMQIGGLSEYAVIDSSLAAMAPPHDAFSPIDAASLPTAGCTALQAIRDARIGPGSRLMVLGGSGGVGSLVVQLAKAFGAAFVAATSTNRELVKALGAGVVVDYRQAKWWEVIESKSLDVIIDCVGCDESWANCDSALARGGRYIAVVDSPDTELRSVTQLLSFVCRIARRALNPFSTSYSLVSCFPKGKDLQELVDAMAQVESGTKHATAVLDPATPVPFTAEDVGRAFQLQRSHRAKGKLVVAVHSE